jgi:RimJ/RimL family protein N-acetyltransferase
LISLARYGGFKTLLGDIMYHLYRTNVYVGFEKDLKEDDPEISCKVDYQLNPGTREELESIFQEIKDKYKDIAIDLITRRRYYDLGIEKCYIAREKITQEPCYITWMISANGTAAARDFIAQHFINLKPNEVLLEGALTFGKFRGKSVSTSITNSLARLARSQGYKRMILFVLQNNKASARVCQKTGYKQFSTIIERRFLFTIKRKIINSLQLEHTRCSKGNDEYS